MERLPERIDSTFRYVLISARRAEQLMMRAAPKIDVPGKPTRVAMQEIDRDLVAWDYGPPPQPVEEQAEGEIAEDAEE